MRLAPQTRLRLAIFVCLLKSSTVSNELCESSDEGVAEIAFTDLTIGGGQTGRSLLQSVRSVGRESTSNVQEVPTSHSDHSDEQEPKANKMEPDEAPTSPSDHSDEQEPTTNKMELDKAEEVVGKVLADSSRRISLEPLNASTMLPGILSGFKEHTSSMAAAAQASLSSLSLLATKAASQHKSGSGSQGTSSRLFEHPHLFILAVVFIALAIFFAILLHRREGEPSRKLAYARDGPAQYASATERFMSIATMQSLANLNRGSTNFAITTLQGESVLQVCLSLPSIKQGADAPNVVGRALSSMMPVTYGVEPPDVQLSTLVPGVGLRVNARCYFEGDVHGYRTIRMYDGNHRLFGVLTRDSTAPLYFLTSTSVGRQLCFEGNFSKHILKVTNERHERLADTGPVTTDANSQQYRVRFAPKADWAVIVLIVCGLVCVDLDEFEARKLDREERSSQVTSLTSASAYSCKETPSIHSV